MWQKFEAHEMSWYSAFPFIVAIALFLASLVAGEIGYRMARMASPPGAGTPGMTQANIVAGAILGLVGLLLAFSFSFGADRYNARRHYVVEEASDLGTVRERAQLFPGPLSTQLLAEVRDYAKLRLTRVDSAENSTARATAELRSEQVSGDIWRTYAKLHAQNIRNSMSKELGLALNRLFDEAIFESDAESDSLPGLVLLMLITSTLVASAATGYSARIDNHRRRIYEVAFALVVAVVVYTILDLNSPYGGFIHNSDETLRHVISLMSS